MKSENNSSNNTVVQGSGGQSTNPQPGSQWRIGRSNNGQVAPVTVSRQPAIVYPDRLDGPNDARTASDSNPGVNSGMYVPKPTQSQPDPSAQNKNDEQSDNSSISSKSKPPEAIR